MRKHRFFVFFVIAVFISSIAGHYRIYKTAKTYPEAPLKIGFNIGGPYRAPSGSARKPKQPVAAKLVSMTSQAKNSTSFLPASKLTKKDAPPWGNKPATGPPLINELASSHAIVTLPPPPPPPPPSPPVVDSAPPQLQTAVEYSPPAPTGGVWAELRYCESGDNYSADTGNGYYGAYQFSLSTWEALGYSGLPSNAPPAVQDAAAQRLQAQWGWGQWPVCSQRLGL